MSVSAAVPVQNWHYSQRRAGTPTHQLDWQDHRSYRRTTKQSRLVFRSIHLGRLSGAMPSDRKTVRLWAGKTTIIFSALVPPASESGMTRHFFDRVEVLRYDRGNTSDFDRRAFDQPT
jgi:hypothetical protein